MGDLPRKTIKRGGGVYDRCGVFSYLQDVYRWWREIECNWPFEHQWIEFQGSAGKRHCPKCDRVEWLMHTRFPRVGEPAWDWKQMN